MALIKIGTNGLDTGVGGKVLQVVTATDRTGRSTTSTSFVTASNTLSVTITPSSISSKIFITVSFASYGRGFYTIFRNSTNLSDNSGLAINDQNVQDSSCMSILDSPSTTSATTYQVYLRFNNGQAELAPQGVLGTITAYEIAG